MMTYLLDTQLVAATQYVADVQVTSTVTQAVHDQIMIEDKPFKRHKI